MDVIDLLHHVEEGVGELCRSSCDLDIGTDCEHNADPFGLSEVFVLQLGLHSQLLGECFLPFLKLRNPAAIHCDLVREVLPQQARLTVVQLQKAHISLQDRFQEADPHSPIANRFVGAS